MKNEYKKLTPKQAKFLEVYISTGNATRAYETAYDITTQNRYHMCIRAMGILKKPVVREALQKMREEMMDRCEMSVRDLLDELEEARTLALDENNPAAAVSATMGKAKLFGMDKMQIDHTSSDKSMSPLVIVRNGKE